MKRSGRRFSIFSLWRFCTTLPKLLASLLKRPFTSEWFDVLAAANSGDADEVPEGWKTVREIAAETGLRESHTWKQLRRLEKLSDGVLEFERDNYSSRSALFVHQIPLRLSHPNISPRMVPLRKPS